MTLDGRYVRLEPLGAGHAAGAPRRERRRRRDLDLPRLRPLRRRGRLRRLGRTGSRADPIRASSRSSPTGAPAPLGVAALMRDRRRQRRRSRSGTSASRPRCSAAAPRPRRSCCSRTGRSRPATAASSGSATPATPRAGAPPRAIGFAFEGVFRQHMIVKGRNRDTAWFAMIDRDWPDLRAAHRALARPGELRRRGPAARTARRSDRPGPLRAEAEHAPDAVAISPRDAGHNANVVCAAAARRRAGCAETGGRHDLHARHRRSRLFELVAARLAELRRVRDRGRDRPRCRWTAPAFAAGLRRLRAGADRAGAPDRPASASIWDTLAIAETLAERHPEIAFWPRDPGDRALARSLAAEMHAGFAPLRDACPMDLRARLRGLRARRRRARGPRRASRRSGRRRGRGGAAGALALRRLLAGGRRSTRRSRHGSPPTASGRAGGAGLRRRASRASRLPRLARRGARRSAAAADRRRRPRAAPLAG